MQTLTLTKPDDMHCHLRDGALLSRTLADTTQQFARAIVMPNLNPALTTVKSVLAYKDRLLSMRPENSSFEPLMTLYLTDNTTPDDIVKAKKHNIVACKLYPAGATTNSAQGVTNIENCFETFAEMQTQSMPLLIHGEIDDANADIFDREKLFIDNVLAPLVERFPTLPIVLEHITTKHAVQFIQAARTAVAATITAHHLYINRNDMLAGGIKPHYYCLPVAKRDGDKHALIDAAISGNPKFFLGTDSAPHLKSKKESACGCAGIYTAHAAMELYAEIFEQHNALDKLDDFASKFGANFYGLTRNTETLTLKKSTQVIPERLVFGEDFLVPFKAGETLTWQAEA